MRRLITVTLLAALVPGTVLSQVVKAPLVPLHLNFAATTQETQSPERKRLLSLLDRLFDQAGQVRSGQEQSAQAAEPAAIGLQLRIADGLWELDEHRARERFEQVFTALGLAVKTEEAEAEKDDPIGLTAQKSKKARDLTREALQLRGEALALLACRDPEWALGLAQLESGESRQEWLNAEIAIGLSRTDPRLAARVARQNRSGFNASSATFSEFAGKLRRAEPPLADQLFSDALTAAEQAQEGQDEFLDDWFDYVFPGAARSDDDDDDATRLKPFFYPDTKSAVHGDLLERFLSFAFDALTLEADKAQDHAKGADSVDEELGWGYLAVRCRLLFLAPYKPERAAAVRARWDTILSRVRGSKKDIRDLSDLLLQPLSLEGALTKARAARTERDRQLLYRRASYLALAEGDTRRAFSFLEKTDPDESDWAAFWRAAAKQALAGQDFDSAYRHAQRVADLEDRIDLISRLSSSLAQSGQASRAAEVLLEGYRLVVASDNISSKGAILLRLADAAALIEPRLGFQIMGSAISEINRPGGGYQPSLDELADNLGVLARFDFDRALLVARSFAAKETMLAAEAAVCLGVIYVVGRHSDTTRTGELVGQVDNLSYSFLTAHSCRRDTQKQREPVGQVVKPVPPSARRATPSARRAMFIGPRFAIATPSARRAMFIVIADQRRATKEKRSRLES